MVNYIQKNDSYFYQEQQLSVGNPFLVTIVNRHLEFPITKVQKTPFEEPIYIKKVITAKIYNKRPELLQKIRVGLEIKDNNGKAYAKIIELKKEPSPIVTTNQVGNSFLKTDPLTYDVTLN